MHRVLRIARRVGDPVLTVAKLIVGEDFSLENISPVASYESEKRNLFKENMKQLKEMANNPARTFVFNHNFALHPPYIFDQNGDAPQGPQYLGGDNSEWHAKTRYVDEIIYLNTWIEDAVSSILDQSDIEPIIIIQGDHGPASTIPIPTTFKNATDELILERKLF